MNVQTLRRTLSLGLLASLAACGGGGGGGGFIGAPQNLSYPTGSTILTTGLSAQTLSPTFAGTVNAFSVTPALPAGLALDPVTGEISGAPLSTAPRQTYTILAANGGGSSTFDLTVEVVQAARFSYCLNEPDSTISVFSSDAQTGVVRQLGFVAASPAEQGPEELVVHPSNEFLYVVNATTDNVSAYALDSNGWPVSLGAIATGAGPHNMVLAPTGDFLYVACEGSREIYQYEVDSALGTLTQVGAALATVDVPAALVLDHDAAFMYVANTGSSSNVLTYWVDEDTGVVTQFGTPLALQGGMPTDITIDPLGEFLYILLGAFELVVPLHIDSNTGAPSYVPPGRRTENGPISVAVHPLGDYAYVLNALSSTLTVYEVDRQSGDLTTVDSLAAGDAPTSVQIDPAGEWLYVTSSGTNEILRFAVDVETGSVREVERVRGRAQPVAISTSRGDSPVLPQAEVVYVTNADSGDVSTYTVDPVTSELTELGLAPLAGTRPSAIAVDPRIQFAYVANTDSNDITIFSIAADGSLAQAGVPHAMGSQEPTAVTVGGSGAFLYAVDRSQGFLTTFLIDQATGELTTLGSFQVGINPVDVAIDPTGQFLYVANEGNGGGTSAISILRVPATTGVPSVSAPPAFVSGPTEIEFHPSGVFLYAALKDDDSIAPYRLNALDGGLEAGTVEVGTGAAPSDIALHPTGKFAYVAYEGRIDDGHVTLFNIDLQTGELATEPVTYLEGVNPTAIAIDPLGNYLYVANRGSDDVSFFTIAPDTGELTPGLPVASGLEPSSMVLTSSFR